MRPLIRPMRLDLFLCERGYAQSRTEAKTFILAGSVRVGDKTVTKPAFDSPDDACDVSVDTSAKRFVSRGGLKLEAALLAFKIDVTGRYAIDIGASSGGFTDCLLKFGAAQVIAVDSGSGQMVDSLRSDPRVTVIENYNARYMKAEDFEYRPTLAVMDVSFISATYIMPAIADVLADGGDFVCLIKPQFEVGRSGLGKGGIVKNDKIRRAAVDRVVDFARSVGLSPVGLITSPIEGGDGNTEFLAHFINGKTEK